MPEGVVGQMAMKCLPWFLLLICSPLFYISVATEIRCGRHDQNAEVMISGHALNLFCSKNSKHKLLEKSITLYFLNGDWTLPVFPSVN